MIVESGATGYSFTSEIDAKRYVELGDKSTTSPRATSFIFHEDFTINRRATNTSSDTTTFYGPVSVIIDEGKTFTIAEEAEVAEGATVTVMGGGTLALGKTLTINGTLVVEDGILDLRAPVTYGEQGVLKVNGTLMMSATASVKLASMPTKIDLSAIASEQNGTYTLITFADGVEPDWDAVTLSWGDLDFITATPSETGLTVTIERTEDNFIVMPMGDSITEGSGAVEDAPSYRKALSEQMLAAGMVPRFVGARIFKSSPIADENCKYHTGLSGHRVQTAGNRGGYLQGATNWLEQAGYPDAVTLMIGTNDFTGTGIDTVFNRWKALVKTMVEMRPNTWIIVAPITPPRSDNTARQTYTTTYNNYIKGLFDLTTSTLTVNGEAVTCVLGTLNAEGKAVFGENAKVMMASMYDAIPASDNTGYFYDNLHPNQAGYDRMAAVWLEAIKSLKGENGGLKDDLTIVDAYQTAGAMNSLTVVFNHEQKSAEGLTVTVGETTVEVASSTLSADGRRVTLTLANALDDGAEVTVAKGELTRTFTVADKAVANRVAAALAKDYVQVKALDMPNKGSYSNATLAKAAFVATEAAGKVGNFDRLGYYVTLARPDGALRYLWVSMDTPDSLKTVASLGLPTSNLRTKVTNLRVDTNMPGIASVTEDGVEGLLQFTPNDILKEAADTAHPVAISGNIFDWNSAFGTAAYKWGAMQVFRLYEEGVGHPDSGFAASTLFSYSRWATTAEGDDEIIFGDLANHQDYTASPGTRTAITGIYTSSFPTLNTSAYSVKRIEIWVRPTETIWSGATEGAWDTQSPNWLGHTTTFANGEDVLFETLADNATSATVSVDEAVAPQEMTVAANAFTFAGDETITVAGTLTVAENASAIFNAPVEATAAAVSGTLAVEKATFEGCTFAAGATVVATDSALYLPNGYTKTGGGAINVALPEDTSLAKGDTLTVLTVGDEMTIDVTDFAAPEGLSLVVDDEELVLGNWVPLPEVGYSAAAASALTNAAPAGVTEIISVTTKTKGGTVSSTAVADANDALGCFTGIADVSDTGAATVTYDFGVSRLTLTSASDNEMTILATFKVEGEKTEADFADKLVFAVTDETGDEVLASTADGTLTAATDVTDGTGERSFTFKLKRSTQLFKVRVQTL